MISTFGRPLPPTLPSADSASFGAPNISGLAVLPNLGLVVTADARTGVLTVRNLTSQALVAQLTLGPPGSGATGRLQVGSARWMTPSPWSSSTILVPDGALGRVVEVDVLSGALVKVWLTGLPSVVGVAATHTWMAVTYGLDTSFTFLTLFDLSGALVWRVGGPALGDRNAGNVSNVGVLLGGPAGVRFSHDGSHLLLAEAYANRVTKWNTSNGAYLGSVGSGFDQPWDVSECWAGAAVSTLVSDGDNNRMVLATAGGPSFRSPARFPGILSTALAPGVGVLVALRDAEKVVLLSSVALRTHPASTTIAVSTSATFAVALTPQSATSGLTYSWTLNGSAVGANAPNFTYTAVDSDLSGGPLTIVCTVTHALGRVVSSPATLRVVRSVQRAGFTGATTSFFTVGLSAGLGACGAVLIVFSALTAWRACKQRRASNKVCLGALLCFLLTKKGLRLLLTLCGGDHALAWLTWLRVPFPVAGSRVASKSGQGSL